MIRYASDERLAAHEYVEFLSRTELAGEYPRQDFRTRIETFACPGSRPHSSA